MPRTLAHLALGALVVLVSGAAGQIARFADNSSRAPRATDSRRCVKGSPTKAASPTPWRSRGSVPPPRLLVKFRPTAPSSTARQLVDIFQGRVVERYDEVPGVQLLGFADNARLQQALEAYRRDPRVEYAELDTLWHLDADPSDPSYGQQWGLENTGQSVNGSPGGEPGVDIEATAAWSASHGSEEVVVAVIDSGVDYTHEDLEANMWTNPGEVPGNGIDDDGNGIVDDVYGMNAVDDSGDPMDDAGHGTHVAGTIGAVGDNGRGVAGVNWTTRIMALKFLSAFGGGATSDAIKCIDYAIDMKRDRGVNVRVVNCSWGGGGRSQALEEAIERAAEAGILFVCAAGNDAADSDRSPHFPSAYEADNVLSVAALAPSGEMAGFSNYGRASVDVAAPGVDILSTLPGNRYDFASGTSMAAPHVTGVAALVLASGPKMKLSELRERLLGTAFAVPGFDGKLATGGRLSGGGALGVRAR